MTNNIDKLIHNLLNNESFPLIPHNPNIDKDSKYLFDFFTNLKVDLIMRELMKQSNHINLNNALLVVSHYKGKIPYFIEGLDYKTYISVKPYLDDISIDNFSKIFYKKYVEDVLSGSQNYVDTMILDYIFEINLRDYTRVAIKLNVDGVSRVFNKDKIKVFYWINSHKSKYNQLKILNQPQFIFDNMNGKLDIDDDTLKYFFEICPVDIKMLRELKKTLPINIIWKHMYYKLPVAILFELVETIDELKFVITIDKIPFEALDNLFTRIQKSYPQLYSQLNSLLLLKNDFSQ